MYIGTIIFYQLFPPSLCGLHQSLRPSGTFHESANNKILLNYLICFTASLIAFIAQRNCSYL